MKKDEVGKIREQAIQDFIKFASKIRERDSWNIGGFLGKVKKEWDEKDQDVGSQEPEDD